MSLMMRISLPVILSLLATLPVFPAMTIIESSDKAQLTYTEPAGAHWITPAEKNHCNFAADKARMVSSDNIVTSGYGFGAGPGTGAEIAYSFSGQNSVSVGFLCHAQGQIAELYLDDRKIATVL